MRSVRRRPMHNTMVDHRAVPGLVAGLAGLASGVAALVLGLPVLAAPAAACALAAGAVSVLQVRRLRGVERDAAGNAALARLLDLPGTKRPEGCDLLDDETGLPDDRYFQLALEGRVAAARRQLWPVSVVLVEVGLDAACTSGRARADALRAFADLLRRSMRESDIACRTGISSFAVILEDTAEEGGVWAAERLQVALAKEVADVRRMAAGVAAYPTHGLEAGEVLVRAQAALTRACATPAGRGLGSVEVALHDFA